VINQPSGAGDGGGGQSGCCTPLLYSKRLWRPRSFQRKPLVDALQGLGWLSRPEITHGNCDQYDPSAGTGTNTDR
jgi:hypothetical protein